jgi:hypothetical protein
MYFQGPNTVIVSSTAAFSDAQAYFFFFQRVPRTPWRFARFCPLPCASNTVGFTHWACLATCFGYHSILHGLLDKRCSDVFAIVHMTRTFPFYCQKIMYHVLRIPQYFAQPHYAMAMLTRSFIVIQGFSLSTETTVGHRRYFSETRYTAYLSFGNFAVIRYGPLNFGRSFLLSPVAGKSIFTTVTRSPVW